MKMEYQEQKTNELMIRTDCVEKAVTILYVTDSHLLEVDDREDGPALLEQVRRKWQEADNVEAASSRQHFLDMIALGQEENVDCLELTDVL